MGGNTACTENSSDESSSPCPADIVDAKMGDSSSEGMSSTQQPPGPDPFQADFRDSSEPKLMTTFGGGSSLMFEMITKKMLDWGNEAHSYVMEDDPDIIEPSTAATEDKSGEEVPRWRPHEGIANHNPNFRQEAPPMNNQGFAKSIWRNVRKRNKPVLWKNALRTYDRMAVLEGDPKYPTIQRSNSHHEGAMLACSKLGFYQQALEIYHYAYQVEQDSQAEFNKNQKQSMTRNPASDTPTTTTSSASATPSALRRSRIRRTVQVTDHMVLSLVRACVRASNQRARNKGTHLSPIQEEREATLRRIPLDTALEVLTSLQENHEIPVVARHLNPLAGAYQSLGYIAEATDILQGMLANRTAGEEPEDGLDILNVYDLCARDKGSYSLLVQGAVVTGDWGAAVEALGDMTKSGLYPSQRHCNIWSEISERQTRPRAVGSWKKKRDDSWADSVR